MLKSIKLISVIFFLFLFTAIPLAFAAEPLQDPFYTQMQETLNAPPIHGISENVDLFSGHLSLLHTDVHLPGNGGLDLTLMRRYNSSIWQKGAGESTLAGMFQNTPFGLGWTMHMGIVIGPNTSRPVVEMPDGSQHPMFRDRNVPGQYISKEYWILKPVILSDGQIGSHWELTLADGTVYTFENILGSGPYYWTFV
jgi:hypothetical protein